MAGLELHVLGEFRATLDGKQLEKFATDKVRALLAYLAVEGGRPHSRNHLATLLWSEWSETAAKSNLRKSLFRLRQTLGPTAAELLTISRASVAFNEGIHYVDLHHFQALSAREDLESLAEAASLYQGALLSGLSLPDAPSFEDWLTVQRRASCTSRPWRWFSKVTELHLVQKDYAAATAAGLRQLALEPWLESAHRQLMRIYMAAGQRSQALAQYEQCRLVLWDELGVEPSMETEQLFVSIEQEEKPAGHIYNFPTNFTPFVGRQEDIERLILRLHDADSRLITVAGTGGTGKTRLASEAARQAVEQGTLGNAYFVPLRSIETQEGVWRTIGQAIGVQSASGNVSTGQIITYAQNNVDLLVLDNYEQLLPGTQAVERLLEETDRPRIVVTSRAPLNLRAEWRLPLSGLPVPGPEDETLEHFASVQLLVSTGQQVQPELTITAENRADIIRICRALAGMPLALEMAGSWFALFQPRLLADQIEKNLDFLVDTRKDIPERHRNLRAIFDHSLAQLDREERTLLGQLTSFSESFTLAAAVQVTSAWLVAFNTFIEHALLQRHTEERYSLHPLLYSFIQDELPQSDDVFGNHAQYYLREVCATTKLPIAETVAAIDNDLPNVRVAWEWAITNGDGASLQMALPGYAAYCQFHGTLREGQQRFAAAAERFPDSELGHRLRLAEAECLRRQGELETAERIVQAVLDSDVSATRLQALVSLAKIRELQGRYEEAFAMIDEALPLVEPNSAEESEIWITLGAIYSYRGPAEKRMEAHQKALSISMARSDEIAMAHAHALLGSVYMDLGQYEAAIYHCQSALEIAEKLNHKVSVARLLAAPGNDLLAEN